MVIGVLDQRAGVLPSLTNGVYTGENSLQAAGIPLPPANFFVFRTAPGANVHATALALGRTFLRNGLDIKESQAEFNSQESITIGLFDLLEGFMGLGLVVGIAALGVIATRAVVERRQEIGMMRAIGFQRAMVRTTFLLESSFVAILGTLLGVGLGLALAKNLVDSIAKNNNSITFGVPWLQIAVIVLIAYIASLLTTFLPSWQASRIYPAEALRYE
jgi:putative ABC transport system permease protein